MASSPTLSAHLLPQCIARGRQLSPDVNIQLLDRIQSDVLLSVRSGEVDFGVVIDPSEKQDLHAQAILSEPFAWSACRVTGWRARKRCIGQSWQGSPWCCSIMPQAAAA